MGRYFPIILLGALGVGIAYYFYQNSESSTGSGSSSGSLYDIIGGAATNSDPALSPAAAAAGAASGAASVQDITNLLNENPIYSSGSRSYSGSSGSSYVADVSKKAATVQNQNYQAIDADFVNYINSQLKNIYEEGSAYNFAKVPDNAVAAATIQNTGINNAGKELLSIVNSDNSYQVYDSRGQIVSSGSAGAFQGNVILNTGSSRSSSGSSGSSSSGSSVSSKKLLNVSVSSSGSSKETVPITADKAAASSAGVYSDKIRGTATIGYKKSSSSGSSGSSSSGSSSSSSGGYAMGGAVRSNTTAGKYTGVK